MPTPPTAISEPPDVPSRRNPALFPARGETFLNWMAALRTQLLAGLANVFANAQEAYDSAAAALASKNAAQAAASAAVSNAAAAAGSAGADVWTSRNYDVGESARSPSSLRVYTARTTGAKPTDPALDRPNWKIASSGGLPDVPYAGTAHNVSLGERSRATNAAAVAFTVPVPTAAGEEWAGVWENGLYTNSFDIGAANLRHNSVTRSGVITNSLRLPIHLVSVAANEWRFA